MFNIIKKICYLVIIGAVVFIILNFSTTKDVRLSSEAIFWAAAATALLTAFLVFIAWLQLEKFNNTTRGDFIHRFMKDFFNEPTRHIITLLEYSALKFKIREVNYGDDSPTNEFPYFQIDKNIIEQLKIKTDNHRLEYTAFEIDDELLGHFDDLGSFEKRDILDISLIYDLSSYYLETVWENEEIQKYIKWQRAQEQDFNDIFEDFEYIYKKCMSFGIAKRKNQWIWLWKLRWFLGNKE